MILAITIFGVTFTLGALVAALLGLWEAFGRLFPTIHDHPPTPVSWVIQFLSWLNQTLNNKK